MYYAHLYFISDTKSSWFSCSLCEKMAGVGDRSKDLKCTASNEDDRASSQIKTGGASDASKVLKGNEPNEHAHASSKMKMVCVGSKDLKRKPEVVGSSVSKKMTTTKDFSRKTMKISAITRAQLEIPFGDTDRVVYCVVASNIHSAGFCVGHAMYDMVGHRNFRVADHYVKDTVLVAFEDPFDVLLVAGNYIRCGPEALMSVRRVSKIEQHVPNWDGYFHRNVMIAPAPEDEHVVDEEDEVADVKSHYDCSRGGFFGGSGGDGAGGGGASASAF